MYRPGFTPHTCFSCSLPVPSALWPVLRFTTLSSSCSKFSSMTVLHISENMTTSSSSWLLFLHSFFYFLSSMFVLGLTFLLICDNYLSVPGTVLMSCTSLPAGPLLKHPIWCAARRTHWRPIAISTVVPTPQFTGLQISCGLIHTAIPASGCWGKKKKDKKKVWRWLNILRHGSGVWFNHLVAFEVCLIGTETKGSSFRGSACLDKDGNWECVVSETKDRGLLRRVLLEFLFLEKSRKASFNWAQYKFCYYWFWKIAALGSPFAPFQEPFLFE